MNDRLLDLMHRWATAPLNPVSRPVLDDPEQRHFGFVILMRARDIAREGWSRVRAQLALVCETAHLQPLHRRVSGVDHGPRDRGANLASFMVGAVVARRMTS